MATRSAPRAASSGNGATTAMPLVVRSTSPGRPEQTRKSKAGTPSSVRSIPKTSQRTPSSNMATGSWAITAMVRSIDPAWHRWQDLVEHRQIRQSWRDHGGRRVSAMDIIIFLAMFVVVLAALGPHHRRTFSLPRAPFGADAEVDRDLVRVLHDVPM